MLPNSIKKYQNSNDLLVNVAENELYGKLILQLTKDFGLANYDFIISEKSTPLALKEALTNAIKNLILTDSNTYKTLLYIVDVPEDMIQKTDTSDIAIYTETVVFLILKRVWKKVWFSANYSR
ncbi:hypothetical protein G1K75_02575 [Tenacibaculum finnmarkense]|uniref:hypothetical protein n=1 Tax=Tenacibaculum finnmarkense TaxID=2781243 RepID=UPI001EFAA5B9|nr:hypothetical protein [Tenacibaculum finnmarkense]MCG8804537.1 hypothetical protein [Tenacibaculum finnmarkense]MCG8855723.1 hypothetical protein [Tenacibaculum finnmarkense]